MEKWARANLMESNKAKCRVLRVGRGNPKHKHRPGGERIGSCPEEKDLGVLDDKKLNMTHNVHLQPRKPPKPVLWPAG